MPDGIANRSPLTLASANFIVLSSIRSTALWVALIPAMVAGSSGLNTLIGVQPEITLPGVPHLTTPSLSRNEAPTALFSAEAIEKPLRTRVSL